MPAAPTATPHFGPETLVKSVSPASPQPVIGQLGIEPVPAATYTRSSLTATPTMPSGPGTLSPRSTISAGRHVPAPPSAGSAQRDGVGGILTSGLWVDP